MADLTAVLRRNMKRALRGGALVEAAEILARLRREAPLDVATRGLELEYLLASRKLDEAAALATQLVKLHPSSARIHYLAARVAYARRRYAHAEDLLREAARLSPHWRLRHWLGKTLTQLGRLDDAEPLLLEVVRDHPHAGTDLAWLYERRGELERAIETLQRYCERYPDDAFGARQLERLRARALDPESLQREVEMLAELGEEVSDNLLAEHVDSLLATGRSVRARELISERAPTLDPRVAVRLAWICHKRRVPDLAYLLFLSQLPFRSNDVKLLSAIEADARRAGRVGELIDAYRELSDANPKLWGRIRRLARTVDNG